MPRDLPPLDAVRAFEVAARRGGFAEAGRELFLSANAVAHQVRRLEGWLGVELFVRGPRGVEVTAVGRRLARRAGSALDDLGDALAETRRSVHRTDVTITAFPSFVSCWLMPRLDRLRAAHPEIDIRVIGSVIPGDFGRDRIDLAVRLGTGPFEGTVHEPLLTEWFRAYASPTVSATVVSVVDPGAHVLLHDEPEELIPDQVDWPTWAVANGIAVPAGRGSWFSHSYLTLDAAEAGAGLAVSSDVLADRSVRAGRLVALPGAAVRSPYRYHVVASAESARRPAVASVRAWLHTEARAFREGCPEPDDAVGTGAGGPGS
ncbi:MAG: LysR substrate-binding domain-containing protein [Actinomycetota bacterium]|nr:LysR substrate-binding domain-containing protein [Actinomycetota bacterium]